MATDNSSLNYHAPVKILIGQRLLTKTITSSMILPIITPQQGMLTRFSTIQFLTEIHRITQPNPYMILLFKYPWEFQSDVLWDILYHIQFTKALCYIIFALLLRLKALLSGL